jgi:hypothetical protein
MYYDCYNPRHNQNRDTFFRFRLGWRTADKFPVVVRHKPEIENASELHDDCKEQMINKRSRFHIGNDVTMRDLVSGSRVVAG